MGVAHVLAFLNRAERCCWAGASKVPNHLFVKPAVSQEAIMATLGSCMS
jgi:hypothetical protein